MHAFLLVLAGLATAVGVFGTLTMLTFCMASGANSSPRQIRLLKQIMLGIATGGLGFVGGAIFLALRGEAVWAIVVGLMPMIILFAGIFYICFRSGFAR